MSATTPSCERQKILLIDDDELISGSLRQYLLAQGCDVDVAVDAATAVTMMSAQQYGTVVVDPYLTGGVHPDSCEVIDRVRALQPAAKVIVLTGYGSPKLLRDAADGRVSALLSKPQSVLFLAQFLNATPPSTDLPHRSLKG
jgi:DNA-binding NtrC family response regulator